MLPMQVKEMIEDGLPNAIVEVHSEDGSHFEAIVVSEAFTNLSMVKQHQAVYALLDDAIKMNAIHALALKTYTPESWEKAKKSQLA
ncbi:putative transcriptional regulator, BolA superfamily [Beggiatoa alba B18LD]|uniref:Putative transcriptional regulator, BolA superfamily n=1 Tax=Beggiatoa alba B18LD TaxID=395493 RepID=I3CDD9_9GAMM|nr:BolA/IbaG family iron-sulfur metabolism protein [Beggiatoa alba]EIJ41632.1 putative transcriptional regulator, BolA superfamily [Beggiatoa alba B18LD]